MKLPIGSYSFYNQFQNCPHKAYHIYVARSIPYVESPEMKWGNDVHAAMEKRIGYGVPLPTEMRAAENIAAQFDTYSKQVPVKVEYQLAMTDKGQPCEWKASNAWFRGKLDCTLFTNEYDAAWMVDWKTGNVREEPFELEAGALLLKVHHPELQIIRGEYFWMETGQNGLRYTFGDHAGTFGKLQRLREEAEGYLSKGDFPKRKNPLCGWCPVQSCEHWKPRK